MNDWNHNGKYDMADSYMDYHLDTKNETVGNSSDWWKWMLLAVMVGICPPIGFIILLIILIS